MSSSTVRRVLKVVFRLPKVKETRQFKVASFDDFMKKVQDFKMDFSSISLNEVKFLYLDEEDDWVTFDSKEEWSEIPRNSKVLVCCRKEGERRQCRGNQGQSGGNYGEGRGSGGNGMGWGNCGGFGFGGRRRSGGNRRGQGNCGGFGFGNQRNKKIFWV